MKIRFSLHYNTHWGESLHVLVTYVSVDGRKRQYDLPMHTQDGSLWTLETAVMENRQHPVNQIQYVYQLEDSSGNVLRREWDLVPRLYSFDGTKDYIFPDQWRDVPLQSVIYTHAYAVTTEYGRMKPAKALRMPLFRRTLVFRVLAPQLLKGEALGVIGNHPALGSWNAARFQRMECLGNYEWSLSVNVYGMPLPLEYKYVIVDEASRQLKSWEDGENRTTGEEKINDGEVLVLHGGSLHVKEASWRVAGVSVPLFSLRTDDSYGVGDFADLRRLVDWASSIGLKSVQLLPLNDTTHSHEWGDSNPYNIVSAYALHPHYMDLEALGLDVDKLALNNFYRQRREMNSLPYSDYPSVDAVKRAYIHAAFVQLGADTLETDAFKTFFRENKSWLEPYALFAKEDKSKEEVYYTQFNLYHQLQEVSGYAHSKGVMLLGDFPIGVSRYSCESKYHKDYFIRGETLGTPPDSDHPWGQNWCFPAWNWNNPEVTKWMNDRIIHMERCFDGVRLDHVLGYFRSWQIPSGCVTAVLGHYSPSLPMSPEEIGQFGITFRRDLFTRPFINDKIINKVFGIHSSYVKEHFLTPKSYGLYELKEDYNTQRKVQVSFEDKHDENSIWIKEGLYRLIENVLFLPDPNQPDMYHPRYGVFNAPVFDILSNEEKGCFTHLYNNFFNERHRDYWACKGRRRLKQMLRGSRMLIVGDDLGADATSIDPVLEDLHILTTEIQSMPKDSTQEFGHLEANPYRSLCTLSTHDMPSLRLLWEENPGRTQRYFVTMLQKEGRAPERLPITIAEEIIARALYSPSMLMTLQLQDWLAMDSELREPDVRSELINAPYDSYNRWQYRMHVTIDKLMNSGPYNRKLKLMIERSRR